MLIDGGLPVSGLPLNQLKKIKPHVKGILQLKWINELETNGSLKMLKSEIGQQCEVINPIAAVDLQLGRGIERRGK